jgi:hypothetical protein
MKTLDDIPTFDIRGLPELADAPDFDLAALPAPWGEQYATAVYGEELDADAVARAEVRVKALIDATGTKSFAKALDRLPEADESVHMVIGHRHSMGDLLPAILSLSGQNVEECRIATLTYSRKNAEEWLALLASGKVQRLAIIVSHYFSKTSSHIFDATAPSLRAAGVQVTAARCHAKLLLCRLADGRTITAEGSANTRSAKTVEQVTIFASPEVFEFHQRWMDKLADETTR